MWPRSRGYALQHRNVRIEPERPDRCSKNEEPGRNDERRLPGTELNQHAEHDRRQGAADIAGHVHHAGNGAGALAANVHWDGPGWSDRAFEEEHRSREAVHGGVGVLGQCRRNDETDAAQEAYDRHRAPRELGVSGLVQQPVRRQPADRIADDSGKQRQGREQSDLQKREMPKVYQIGRQPAQEDPQAIDVGEVGAHNRPHIRRSQQGRPGYARLSRLRLIDIAGGVEAANMLDLGLIHERMLFGEIPVGQEPQDRPDDPRPAAKIEYRVPAVCRHDEDDNRGRNGGAKAARAVGHTLDETALVPRIP
jgi:hypothetical protein